MTAAPTRHTQTWPAQQLAEFLAFVSAQPDPGTALHAGVERVAEALDAEIVAVIRPGRRSVAVGYPSGEVDEALLRDLAGRDRPLADVPPLGLCAVAREPIDLERIGRLVVVRAARALDSCERDQLRGMARVLGLACDALGHRRLLERVSDIQRRIVRRAASHEVLRAIVDGAAELTDSPVAVMYRADPQDPSGKVVMACAGQDEDDRADPLLRGDLAVAMTAPVCESAAIIGSLAVGCHSRGRRYSVAERAALQTFAEHASMALTDVRLVEDALHRATHDPLTGLPNRALFRERLAEALAAAGRSGRTVAVLFIDIDRFKTVNDSLGHTVGDELLLAAAGRLRGCVRPGDVAARLGGDEFAVLAADADETAGRLIAGRILGSFGEPFMLAGRRVRLGASIGIAIAAGPEDDPLRDGDLAMYQAKANGRNRQAVFRPSMRDAARERLELESALRGAGSRGELTLEYQPIVELAGGRPRIREALVRWDHPERGRLAPAAFIPLAEESREVSALGRWVLRAACAEAAAWRGRPGEEEIRVAVNVSPIQLHETDLVAEVRAALERAQLPPRALVLEVTESVIMQDDAAAVRHLGRLKELGVGLAIDDFGTGYCSLEYLRRFPFDVLKIAGGFIADICAHGSDASLTRAILELGQGFGLAVVAEGIERPEQLCVLRELGCPLGQGYLLGRPAPVAKVAAATAGVAPV